MTPLDTQSETADSASETSPFNLVVSEDKMLAVLEAYAPIEIDEEEVISFLAKESKIVNPNREAVRTFVEMCASLSGEVSVPVARGTEPVDGQDGYINWAFDAEEELPGENDRIDWRNRNKMWSAEKGELLGSIVPAVEGHDGVDVYGKQVPAKPGKPATLNTGPNVTVSQDGTKVMAEASGMVLRKGNTVRIEPVLKIRGNVDFDCGNIDFKGDVTISGNVPDLFVVKATKDITIGGCVEAATVEAGGNLTIKSGISGKRKGTVTCGGDLHAKYIDYASAKCNGDLIVDVEVIDSQVESLGSVLVKQKGIIGGRLIVAQTLECPNLGSDAGTPTLVIAGYDGQKASRLDELSKQVQKLSEKAKGLANRLEVLEKVKDRLPANKLEFLDDLAREHAATEEELERVKTEARELSDETKNLLANASIKVKEMAYQGLLVEMGGTKKRFFEAMEGPFEMKFDVAKKRILLLSERKQ